MDRSATAHDSRPRVLLVTHYFPARRGGVQGVAGELASRLLQSEAIHLTWLSSDTDEPPNLPGLVSLSAPTWNGMEKYEVPVPLWRPDVLIKLWRLVGLCDVVHIHDALYPGNICAAVIALMRRKRLLITQHVGQVPYRNRVLRSLVSIGNRTVASWLLVHADRVVFISAAVCGYFTQRCRWRRPPQLIPNGVDIELFRLPDAEERARARASLLIPSTQPVFLFIGRFVAKKGLPLLHSLARGFPDAKWLFAGNGTVAPEQWGLANVCVYRDRERERLRELIWASDLLLLPSESEGFPLVVQEGLACGVPALVTRDIALGYPPSHDVLLLESLGEGATERWLERAKGIVSGAEPVPSGAELAAFAREHWSWDRAVAAYREIIGERPN